MAKSYRQDFEPTHPVANFYHQKSASRQPTVFIMLFSLPEDYQ
jgi:hypothetical protein